MQKTARDIEPHAPTDDPSAKVRALVDFLDTRLDPLVDRSIEIAKLNGYAPFTTTIRAAWVEAILSITESLGNYLSSGLGAVSGPHATNDYKSDPRFSRMRMIARQHRSLGITMPMYVGLFKHFRNLYVAELDLFPGRVAPILANRVRDFFDETELSISADWYNSDDNLRLREMQERARTITLDKDRYFAIFESLRNPAFLLDKTHNLVNANQAAAEMFLGDAKAGEIIYLRSMRQRKNSLRQVIDRIMEAVSEADQSVWLETLNGARCFDVRMKALHDAVENIAIGHVVLLNDVTEHRRAAEKAQKSERGMSRFLATMSHEIRTPLHSVLGATELLRTADVDTAATYLDLIENAGQTLLQTLNNVLDYSKLENAPLKPRPVEVDIATAIRTFERVSAVGPNRRRAKFDFDLSEDLPRRARIDWAMTQQVLSNLVSNALRADDGRGIEISVRCVDGGEPILRFEVRDHGPGISAQDVEALFRPFEKAIARETGSGGAGLGLAISHHLVEAMRGRIGYRNLDAGALVWFEVPYENETAPSLKSIDASDQAQQEPDLAPRCLLVDDDPIGSTVTSRQLERLGFEVARAATHSEADDVSALTAFDVFVVDYILPDGDGPSLVRDLRNRLASGPRYVALTANVEALESNEDLSKVFDVILAKPVDQGTLFSALRPLLRQDAVAHPGTPSGITANLAGLSPETVSAMAEAYRIAWGDFQHILHEASNGFEPPDLAFQAHRLAGSSAILGLAELEAPLRELEKRWPDRHSTSEIAALLEQLDRDLDRVAGWAQICSLAGHS